MTKAEQARITAWRLRILQREEREPRQVARTCRYFGISRTAFYRWKRRFDDFGGQIGETQYACEIGGIHAVNCGEMFNGPGLAGFKLSTPYLFLVASICRRISPTRLENWY